MTRLVVLLAISATAVVFGTVACGGNDKPPLTPDSEVKTPDVGDAGPSAPSAPSAAPAPAK